MVVVSGGSFENGSRSSNQCPISAKGIISERPTFTTLGAFLAMGNGLHPLSFASTASFTCTWRLVLLCVTAGVFVNDVRAHVDELSLGVEAHLCKWKAI